MALPLGASPVPGHAYPLVTVGALIVGPSGRLLLIRTHKWRDLWGVPGGKVDIGETLLAAVRREVREETGLELGDVVWAPTHEAVDHPQFHRPAHFVLLNFVARAGGEAVSLNDEAQDHAWVTPEAALAMDLNAPTRSLVEHYLAHGFATPRLVADPARGVTHGPAPGAPAPHGLPGRGGALVTGSARGIGRAIALALAADGLDVAVHYRHSEREARQVVAEAEALGVRALALQADVTVEGEAQRLVDDAALALGGLRVLVNNVGDYHKGPLAELDAGTWHHMIDTNLHATFTTCQRAVPIMRGAGGGRIVNLGYAGAELLKARPGIVAYQLAKTGVILYTKALARSEAAHGITANVVSPGVMENSVSLPLDQIPMGRVGTLEELVGAVRYLLSPPARYVTGVHLEVAGGWNL